MSVFEHFSWNSTVLPRTSNPAHTPPPQPTMEPFHAAHPGARPQRHLCWKTTGMVAALVTCLLITGGLLFSLMSAQRAMATQRLCPQFDDNDRSLEALRFRIKEGLWRLSKKDQWLDVFTACAVAMVVVSLLVMGATLLWLKYAATKTALFKRLTQRSSHTLDDSPPAYNPHPHNFAYTHREPASSHLLVMHMPAIQLPASSVSAV